MYSAAELTPGLLFLAIYTIIFHFLSRIREPRLPTNWPILGMLPAIIKNINNFHEWITFLLQNSNCTFKFCGPWFLGMDCLGTCLPANVHYVFNTNFANYPKGGDFSEMFDVLGDGIFNADGQSWRNQRKKAHSLISQPSFCSFVMNYSRDKVETELVQFLNHVADMDLVVDLQDVFSRLTFDMTCYLIFGVDPKCLSPEFPNVPFARAMDDAMEAIFIRHLIPSPCWKLMRWLNIGPEKKLSAAYSTMDKFAANTTSVSESLISSYLGYGDEKYVRDTIVNYMLAGRDTVSAALSWFFWLLSKNAKHETKILDDDIYLHAALCEALRLYPPVPYEHKMPVREDVLPSGEKVMPGRKLMFSMYSMGRMEGIWGEDCLEFRPERWITERGTVRHEAAYKFVAFNCGPRSCVGKEVAFVEMKAVAKAVVRGFRIEEVQGQVVEPKLSVILHMKNGWKVRIKKRNVS